MVSTECDGDLRTARDLVGASTEDYATAGFGWHRYTDRLAEVRRALDAA